MTNETTKTFNDFPLHPALLKTLEKLNFNTPTPIQALSLEHSLKGLDVQGEASTGTGKTLAFLIPLIQASLENRSFQALVLVPTRELVTQVGQVIESFCKAGLRVEWIGLNGGTSIVPQLRRLRKAQNIYVGTPGRITDHLERGSIHFDNLQAFVLDEADRMLDMGFAPQIKNIQSYFPEEKPQTLFFSATYPEGVKKLVASLLENPVQVRAVSKEIQKPDIHQDAFFMESKEKFPTLVKQLEQREGSVLVFSQTQHSTEKLAHRLNEEGHNVGRIHGGLNQGQRNRTLRDFREGRTRVLVATDVAARGLDVEHVNHVINFDVPQQAEDYIHRIGRTGRAGRRGEAISFVSNDDRHVWREIITLVSKQLEVELPAFFNFGRGKPSDSKPKKFGAGGGGRGGRFSKGGSSQGKRFGGRSSSPRGGRDRDSFKETSSFEPDFSPEARDSTSSERPSRRPFAKKGPRPFAARKPSEGGAPSSEFRGSEFRSSAPRGAGAGRPRSEKPSFGGESRSGAPKKKFFAPNKKKPSGNFKRKSPQQ